MDTTDRMGGFIAAKIIPKKDIKSFAQTFNGANSVVDIQLHPGASIFEINSKKYGISPQISEANEKSGTIFHINIEIASKSPVYVNFVSFNQFLAILQNPQGEQYVFGTPNFPLSATSIPALSNRADGPVGYILKMAGKQPMLPLQLIFNL